MTQIIIKNIEFLYTSIIVLHNYFVISVVIYSAESVVAVVSPGDMLVVPPYWYHHVETLEESVSVNVWSDAPEYNLMNRM